MYHGGQHGNTIHSCRDKQPEIRLVYAVPEREEPVDNRHGGAERRRAEEYPAEGSEKKRRGNREKVCREGVFLLVAAAIKIDDRGPVFYVSTRVGRFGKEFRFYKFRSMKVNADELLDDIRHLNETEGQLFKMKNDPRVTRVGRFLRRTSLDELPQIFNIIKGDISFVGPRSPLPEEVKNYTDYSMQRLSVIGGLTCYWQISGRSDIDFNGMVKLDCKYIEERSILTDLKILFLTLPAVIKGDGAY